MEASLDTGVSQQQVTILVGQPILQLLDNNVPICFYITFNIINLKREILRLIWINSTSWIILHWINQTKHYSNASAIIFGKKINQIQKRRKYFNVHKLFYKQL